MFQTVLKTVQTVPSVWKMLHLAEKIYTAVPVAPVTNLHFPPHHIPFIHNSTVINILLFSSQVIVQYAFFHKEICFIFTDKYC